MFNGFCDGFASVSTAVDDSLGAAGDDSTSAEAAAVDACGGNMRGEGDSVGWYCVTETNASVFCCTNKRRLLSPAAVISLSQTSYRHLLSCTLFKAFDKGARRKAIAGKRNQKTTKETEVASPHTGK